MAAQKSSTLMKTIALLLGLVLVLSGCGKVDDSATVTTEKSGEIDAIPFVLDTALAKAKTENKPVLLEFTGSDWCPPCKALDKEVLGTKDFQEYAANNLVFGKLDFPQRKPQTDEVKSNNAALSEKFAIKAFPTLVLLKSDGTELWRQEGFGGGGPKDFIAQVEAKKK